MPVTANKYNQMTKMVMGQIDLNSDTLKLALVTSAYTFDAAHTLFDNGANNSTDPSFCEVASGSGYSTGGSALTAVVLTSTGAVCALHADNLTFTNLTKTFRGAIVYAVGTFEGVVNPLLFYVLFDDTPADKVIVSTDFVVKWDTSGILVI